MPETITVRTLGPDDLAILVATREGLFDNPIRPDQARDFLEEPNHILALAFDGEDAVGMVSGQILLHPDKAPAFFIAEVGVREKYQRRGIAKRLCCQIMDEARRRGCEGLWLATELDNIAARALYRSLDARETGGIVVYDWDDAMDGHGPQLG